MPEISIDQLTDKEVLDAAEMVETTGIDVITAICAATNKAIRGDDEEQFTRAFNKRLRALRGEKIIKQEDLNYSASKLADEMEKPELKALFHHMINEVYTGGAMVIAHAAMIVIEGFNLDACMTALVGYHKGELTAEQAKKTIGLG